MTETSAFCDGVSFRYGRRRVFTDFNVSIPCGITGLLGPNGAGKSTLQSLLSTQHAPRAGRVVVLGNDAGSKRGREVIRGRIGVLTQRFPLVGSMRILDTVAYAAWAQGMSRRAAHPAAERALEEMGIGELAGRRCRSLSGGQRQRVGLAAALVHRPELLILDEPSAGLDPHARISLRKTLLGVSQRCSVILSTHLVDDVLAVCDQIIVLNRGRVAFEGSSAELADRASDPSSGDPGSDTERGYSAVLDRAVARGQA